MNKIEQRVATDSEAMRMAVEMLEKGQENSNIFLIYKELAGVSQVRWKDSVKEVVGLTPALIAGLDV
jgi:hypothetical protein